MKRLLTSCFGLGLLPLAPGTWGSIPPVAIFALLAGVGTPVGVVTAVMVAMVIAGSVVCVRFAPEVIARTGSSDPSEVVADEFAGQALALLPAAFILSESVLAANSFVVAALGFALFRLFDILKPWPIRKLERLADGWGILADDLLAGVYAAILLPVLFGFIPCRVCF